MSFILSPYDAPLDLLKNEDLKLYLEATKGLKEGNLYFGKKTDFDKFSKLMGKAFKNVRVMEILMIPTKRDTTNTDVILQRIPIEAGILNLFEDSKVTKGQVKEKVDAGMERLQVWNDYPGVLPEIQCASNRRCDP